MNDTTIDTPLTDAAVFVVLSDKEQYGERVEVTHSYFSRQLERRAIAAENESEGRRRALDYKEEQVRHEWRRAENAEAALSAAEKRLAEHEPAPDPIDFAPFVPPFKADTNGLLYDSNNEVIGCVHVAHTAMAKTIVAALNLAASVKEGGAK